MELVSVLEEIGLTSSEAKVYLSLLKLGTCAVHKLQEDTKLHRTNIYDFLDKLQNKGLVSSYQEAGVQQFTAAKPEKLKAFLLEKQMLVDENLRRLNELSQHPQEQISVEVYRGKKGGKIMFNEILKNGEDFVCFGVDENMWEQRFSLETKRHYRQVKKINIQDRVLTSETATVEYKDSRYRYVPEEFFSPSPIIVYGNTVCTIIWEPLTIIMVRNKSLAEAQKKHFELVWKLASKKPKGFVKVIE